MSTLPLISHHLFVSAVAHDSPTESSYPLPHPADAVGEAPLEVIDAASEIPAEPRSRSQRRFRQRAARIS